MRDIDTTGHHAIWQRDQKEGSKDRLFRELG